MRTAARCICSLLMAGPAFGQIPPSLSALCPKAVPGEIVVCADADPPKSRYRLPVPVARDRGDPNTVSVSRERNALFDHDSGGIGSCGASGAAGNSAAGRKSTSVGWNSAPAHRMAAAGYSATRQNEP